MQPPSDWQVCRGYPVDHECPVVIPIGKYPPLCWGCMRTRDLEQQTIRAGAPAIPHVSEVLADLPEFVLVSCPCGGDAEAPYHDQSLLHAQWAARQNPPPESGSHRSAVDWKSRHG